MKNILYILALSLVMFGCKREDTPAEQLTGVAMTIKLNGNYNSDTKASVSDDYQMELKHFSGKIMQNGNVLQQWADLSKMPSVVNLNPADNYVFEIQTGGVRGAINEVPMYRGEKQFEVKDGQLTSLIVEAHIDCMAASVTLQDAVANLTGYKLSFYNLQNPAEILYTVTQAQNTPVAKKAYFGAPFAFGVKIEGRLNGKKWSKNIVQFNDIQNNVLHSIIVK